MTDNTSDNWTYNFPEDDEPQTEQEKEIARQRKEDEIRSIMWQEARRRLDNPEPDPPGIDVRGMVTEMRGALQYSPLQNKTQLLEEQARVLDMAFRRLLANADVTYRDFENRIDVHIPCYAAAFKAQEQFCRTVKALEALQKKAKREKRDSKRDEQNE